MSKPLYTKTQMFLLMALFFVLALNLPLQTRQTGITELSSETPAATPPTVTEVVAEEIAVTTDNEGEVTEAAAKSQPATPQAAPKAGDATTAPKINTQQRQPPPNTPSKHEVKPAVKVKNCDDIDDQEEKVECWIKQCTEVANTYQKNNKDTKKKKKAKKSEHDEELREKANLTLKELKECADNLKEDFIDLLKETDDVQDVVKLLKKFDKELSKDKIAKTTTAKKIHEELARLILYDYESDITEQLVELNRDYREAKYRGDYAWMNDIRYQMQELYYDFSEQAQDLWDDFEDLKGAKYYRTRSDFSHFSSNMQNLFQQSLFNPGSLSDFRPRSSLYDRRGTLRGRSRGELALNDDYLLRGRDRRYSTYASRSRLGGGLFDDDYLYDGGYYDSLYPTTSLARNRNYSSYRSLSPSLSSRSLLDRPYTSYNSRLPITNNRSLYGNYGNYYGNFNGTLGGGKF